MDASRASVLFLILFCTVASVAGVVGTLLFYSGGGK